MASEVKTNKISPSTSTTVTLGDASDLFQLPASAEIDIASGATLDVNGTIDVTGATTTGFPSNTPYFYAYLGSDQAPADDTWTKVDIDTVSFQTGATYNTTDNRWTPAVAGKYFLHIEGILRADTSNKLLNTKAAIYKNGAVAVFYEGSSHGEVSFTNGGISASAILDLDADDYVEFWARINVVSGNTSIAATGGVAQCTHFMGFKLVD